MCNSFYLVRLLARLNLHDVDCDVRVFNVSITFITYHNHYIYLLLFLSINIIISYYSSIIGYNFFCISHSNVKKKTIRQSNLKKRSVREKIFSQEICTHYKQMSSDIYYQYDIAKSKLKSS